MFPFDFPRTRAVLNNLPKSDVPKELITMILEMAEELDNHKKEIMKLKQEVAKLKK